MLKLFGRVIFRGCLHRGRSFTFRTLTDPLTQESNIQSSGALTMHDDYEQ